MNETLLMIAALAAGLLLGSFFYGGLWWTVRKGLVSSRPGLWFGVSLTVRLAVVLAAFYYFSRGHGMWLLACFIGFMIARLAVTWFTKEKGKEGSHAH